MSLLDDLKQQADRLQQDEDQATAEARRQAVYQEKIRPRMHAILNYLGELIEQLKIVDLDVRHDYTLPGIGCIQGLRQGGYVLNADSTDETKLIRLKFYCTAENEQEFAIKPKAKAKETIDFLESQSMRYAEWPIRDSGQIVGINLQLQIKVNINFIFQVDEERGYIKMVSSNFADFEVERNMVRPESINEEWLDNLGNYILRKNNKLQTLEIDEAKKDSIRQRLEEEKRLREEELRLAIQREEEEREEKKRNSFLGKLRNLRKG